MHKLTVTIGIPAHNEEKNISLLIHSLLHQQTDNFILKKILINSDASTDTTVKIVRAIKDDRIQVIDGRKRIGQSQRINGILDSSRTDITILLDADIIPANSATIRNLVAPFVLDNQIGFVSGQATPLPGKSFVEKSVNSSIQAYDYLKVRLNNGDNPYCVKGCILALGKKLVKSTRIPKSIVAGDVYFYFSCLGQGYKFKYAGNARVNFKSPDTLSDHIKQNTRFINSYKPLEEAFGSMVKDRTRIPFWLLSQSYLIQIIKTPIYSLGIFVINSYCRILNIKNSNITVAWNPAATTKENINNA